MSTGHLHRRTSSAAAYQSLSPTPGVGDVSDGLEDEAYSSSRPRPRTSSFSAQQRALEELEEKEGFIPTSVYDIPGQPRRGGRRTQKKSWIGWKGKLVLVLIAGGGLGAAAYYVLYYDGGLWWTGAAGTKEAELVGLQSSAVSSVKATKTAVANYAQSTKTSMAASDDYSSEEDYYQDDEAESHDEEEEDSSTSSSLLVSTNSSRSTFDSLTSDTVAKLLNNGTLAAYKWHETLPSLNSTGLVSSSKKANGGRLIVVGASFPSFSHFLLSHSLPSASLYRRSPRLPLLPPPPPQAPFLLPLCRHPPPHRRLPRQIHPQLLPCHHLPPPSSQR
jgi:hypothetical protein